MKKLLAASVVLLFVLVMSGVANAGPPHGGYNIATDYCDDCHEIHGAASPDKLLRSATVGGICSYCHFVGGGGDIYVIASPGADHNPTASLTTVPGGSNLLDSNGLACSSCHSVHGTLAVNTFTSDSTPGAVDRALHRAGDWASDRRYLCGAGTVMTVTYGSLWCADCHNLRHTGASNHPVATTSGATYNDVAPTVAGNQSLGRANAKYIMTPSYTAKAIASTAYVNYSSVNLICQQCHEDSRNVTAAFVCTPNQAGDNPRWADFPHSTTNDSFVVEGGATGGTLDDLCLNCHDTDILP